MIVNDLNVYKLANIIRYSQQNKIKKESVAEHSFFVMWFVERLCTKYQVSDIIRLKALEAALLHDVPEVITNDITYDVKKMIPEISALMEPYEKQVISEHSVCACNTLFYPVTDEDAIAKAIVKYADVLSVLQYCSNEESLGNKSFVELRKATEKRIKDSRDHLESVLKERGMLCQQITI